MNILSKTNKLVLDRINPREPAPRRKKSAKPRDHWVGTRFIPPEHAGRVAVCFATGPSLTHEIVEQVRPYHEAGDVVCCGLSDSYRIVPYLDEFYSCDKMWWKHHIENSYLANGHTILDYPARLWGNVTARSILEKYPHIHVVQGYSRGGFSPHRDSIHWGGNSGFQLLNLVYHMRVRRILLVGYNMGIPRNEPAHFFGAHPQGLPRTTNYRNFVKQYHKIDPKIRSMIVNCTHPSELDCFRVGDLQQELDKARAGE